MIADLLRKVAGREDLTREEMALAVGEVVEGGATPAQIGAFLVALRMKGETVEEITGAAEALRARVTRVRAPADRPVLDTCGTGGDSSGTFNISTAAAVVSSAAGACVAKHGNRAVSSRAGSADVLEALGIAIDVPVDVLESSLEQESFAFLFAPALHPAMRRVGPARRELGLRTIFNLLGPLANPAGAPRQVLGVYDPRWVRPLCEVLANLGSRRALVVHSRDGLDEISLSAPTIFAELRDGTIRTGEIEPAQAGLEVAPRSAIAGGDAGYNAGLIERVLRGERGPARDAVLLNAAAALCVADMAEDLAEGVRLCARAVDGGAAVARLEGIRRIHRPR